MKHNFRELQIWQEGIEIAIKTCQICQNFPKEELFGQTAQMKKASVSISSNIAEGCGRGTDAQLVHFLDIALGSTCELETQVIIAEKLNFLASDVAKEWIASIQQIQKRTRTFRDKFAV